MIKDTLSQKIFNFFNVCLMLFLVVIMLYPLIYVLFASFSKPGAFMAHKGLLLLPAGFSMESYEAVFRNPMIARGYINSLIIVFGSLIFNILLTSMGAYFLSRRYALFKNTIMVMIVFTMFFSGGLIPFYLAVRGLRLDNSLWAIIIPFAINTFNLIIMRTSFQSLPDSFEESAKIDGAGHFTILFRIILPLSLPVLAVMILYYGVSHWNGWFYSMIFLRNREWFPIQLILREILISNDTSNMDIGLASGDREMIGETIKYAVIIVATVPILALYPFLQKYFVKGALVGGVKG